MMTFRLFTTAYSGRCRMVEEISGGILITAFGVMAMLDKAAQPYQVILTKVDKVKADYLEKLKSSITVEVSKNPASFPTIAITSSRKGKGISELRASLARLTDS